MRRGEPPLALKPNAGYGVLTIPAGGLGEAATMIGVSLILRLTCARALSGGIDESVPVTEKGYAPAVTGVPDSRPEALRPRPGGSGPDSVHFIGGVPPVAAKV